MTQQELAEQIGRILKVGSDYFSQAQGERIDAALAREQVASGHEVTTGASMLEAAGRCNQARTELTKIGYPLAEVLEQAGRDPSTLLRFLQRIDGGGGSAAASRLWEDLKVELERATLQGAHAPTPPPPRHKWVAAAMMRVHDNPDWTDTKIAEDIGIHPSQLSRCPEYRRAAEMARAPKKTIPAGHLTSDSKTGPRDVEAIDPSGHA